MNFGFMSFDFLVEMAWKSALISGAALAIAAALRFRPAGERSAVLRMAVAMILALPLIALLLPALPIVTQTIHESAPTAPVLLPSVDALPISLAQAQAAAPAAASTWDDPTPLILWLWIGGAAMVAARLLAGLWTLRRWTRNASAPDLPEWGLALKGMQHDAFQQIPQGQIQGLRQGLQNLQGPALQPHTRLDALNSFHVILVHIYQ